MDSTCRRVKRASDDSWREELTRARASPVSCLSFGVPASARRGDAGPAVSRGHFRCAALTGSLRWLPSHAELAQRPSRLQRQPVRRGRAHADLARDDGCSRIPLPLRAVLRRQAVARAPSQGRAGCISWAGSPSQPLERTTRLRSLARLLGASASFDAVVCHSIWSYCIFAPVVSRAGLASILYLHDIPDPNGAFYRWAWLSPPALCIANSAATAAPLAQMLAPDRVCIVHPLVNPPPSPSLEAIHRLRVQWGANPEDVIVLQASRFDSWKGHRNLLEALGAMRDVPSWRCWIAGAPQRPCGGSVQARARASDRRPRPPRSRQLHRASGRYGDDARQLRRLLPTKRDAGTIRHGLRRSDVCRQAPRGASARRCARDRHP